MKLIAYGKTNWGKDFPSALEDQAEVKKYVSVFYYALNPLLKELSDRDEHIMRACSLLVILPPPPGMPLRDLEIPMDLTTMRLPDWVNYVWDLATGMVMLLPTFLVTGKVIQSSVLRKLERVAGVKSCRFCLHPHTVCGCSQISAWSHTSTRQTLATVTTTRSHNSTSVSTSIMCPPPGLLPQGAAAPTSTYSEALALDQAPLTRMRGVSWPPLPRARYPSVDPRQMAPNPRMEALIRQECPASTPKGAKNSLSTTSTGPSFCHPFCWDWERNHPRNDQEIAGVGAPDHHHRLWLRALHQESRSPSPDWRGYRTGPSGSDPGKESVSSPKHI